MQPTTTDSHQFMIRKMPLIQRRAERPETTIYINDQLISEAIRELQNNELFLDERLAAIEC